MKRWTAALPLLLWIVAGCSDSGTAPTACVFGQGPALDPTQGYILEVGTLSEDWGAVALNIQPHAVETHGLTGVAPNDVDVVMNRAYILNSGDNTISAVDLSTGGTRGCIDTGTGTSPWAFAADPSNPLRGWVTTFTTGELLEVDLNHLKVIRRVTVGPALEGLLVTADRVQVTLTGFDLDTFTYGQGQVVTYDKATLTETARADVPTNPQFLLTGKDGRTHVVCTGDFGFPAPGTFGKIVRLEADGATVRDTLELGGSPAKGTVSLDGIAYLVSYAGGVLSYNTDSFQAVHGIDDPLLPETGYMDVLADGPTLFAVNFEKDAMAVVTLAGETRRDDVPLASDGPVALAARPPIAPQP